MNLSQYVRFVQLKVKNDKIFWNEKFLVDYLTETISVNRLDRFVLTVICLVLFIYFCLFIYFFFAFLTVNFDFKCLYFSYKYKVKFIKLIRLRFVSN